MKRMSENEFCHGGLLLSMLNLLRPETAFYHEEEDDHRDAAVEHRGADVVDEIRNNQTCNSDPYAVD